MTDCLVWERGKTPEGYGYTRKDGVRWYVHRLAYQQHVGSLVPGMTIDHLCRNRACYNPLHLEQVTRGENVLRGSGNSASNARLTHCKNGHKLDGDNLVESSKKYKRRVCRLCHNTWYRNKYHLKVANAAKGLNT